MTRLCKHGWINQYIEYTRPQESPAIFHTWTSVSTIASVLRRRIWMDRGYYTLFPNLYTILVSASGVGNKTTAIKIGTEDILAKALPDLNIMRGSITVPSLVDLLVDASTKHPLKDAELTVFCEEFKVFAKGLYADSGLIETLTKLYDNGMYEYNTRGHGSVIVERPCLNMIAASTPEWLTTGSASDFIGGGFSSRIIPVAILKREKVIAWPDKTIVEKDMEAVLMHDLIEISKLSGQIFVTTEAKSYFAKWYDVRDKYRIVDNRLDGYYSKKHDLVLKLSIILSTSMGDEMIVDVSHIETALALLGKVELNIPFAFQGVAWGEQAKFQDRVRTKIKEEDVVTHAQLLGMFRFCMSTTDLRSIINTLLEEEVICWERAANISTGGRPKIVYKDREKRIKNNVCIEVGSCHNMTCEFKSGGTQTGRVSKPT